MKKLMLFAVVVAIGASIFAQGIEAKSETAKVQSYDNRRDESSVWPAFFAVSQWPAATDVVGLRLTIPFSTAQENVTGIDLGLWGKSQYFEGIQINLLRNDVMDDAAAFQVGIYNSVGGGDLLGLQVGLWNEAEYIRGFQAGLVNVAGSGEGIQVGLINRAETLYGFQVGLINVIRDAEMQFLPVANIGF